MADDFKVTLQRPDEPDIDLTEHVKVLYDLIVQSMDWGSGFIDTDEMVTVTEVGEAICAEGLLDNWAFIRQMQKPHPAHSFDPDRLNEPSTKPHRTAKCKVCGYDQRSCEYNQPKPDASVPYHMRYVR